MTENSGPLVWTNLHEEDLYFDEGLNGRVQVVATAVQTRHARTGEPFTRLAYRLSRATGAWEVAVAIEVQGKLSRWGHMGTRSFSSPQEAAAAAARHFEEAERMRTDDSYVPTAEFEAWTAAAP